MLNESTKSNGLDIEKEVLNEIDIDFGDGDGKSIIIYSHKGKKNIDNGIFVLEIRGDKLHVVPGNTQPVEGSQAYFINMVSGMCGEILNQQNRLKTLGLYNHKSHQHIITEGKEVLDISKEILSFHLNQVGICIESILKMKQSKLYGVFSKKELETDEGKKRLLALLI